MSFNNCIGSLHFWVIIEDKVIQRRWLRLQIAKKCLEILLLLYNLHILASDQRKFLSRFEELSLQKATFENLF